MINTIKDLRNVLDSLIKKSSNVFIVGHNEPDFDAIGSAIGLQVYAKNIGKKAYIVVDDTDLEPGVKKIVEENKEKFHIIRLSDFVKMKDEKSLLILTDVNKSYMISVKNHLDEMGNIIIIDHHRPDEKTVKTKNTYINLETSSASEVVAKLLRGTKNMFYDAQVANYLLSGIILDTQRFSKHTSACTHDIVEHLIKKGASTDFVNDLFLREFEEDKKINNLVFGNTAFRTFTSGLVQNKNIAFTLNREAPDTIYKREDLAKAADKVMRYKVDAAFAIGYVKDNLLSVSARSKSDIDVSDILTSIEGIQSGGNPNSAGAKVEGMDIYDLEKLIVEKATEYLENTHDDPFVLKKTRKL